MRAHGHWNQQVLVGGHQLKLKIPSSPEEESADEPGGLVGGYMAGAESGKCQIYITALTAVNSCG